MFFLFFSFILVLFWCKNALFITFHIEKLWFEIRINIEKFKCKRCNCNHLIGSSPLCALFFVLFFIQINLLFCHQKYKFLQFITSKSLKHLSILQSIWKIYWLKNVVEFTAIFVIILFGLYVYVYVYYINFVDFVVRLL